jgi:hypothetical protein
LQGIKEGWYDGGSIAFAVVLVIVVTGIILSFLGTKVYDGWNHGFGSLKMSLQLFVTISLIDIYIHM